MLLVDLNNIESVLQSVRDAAILAIDTETTGLSVPAGDRLFSIQILPKGSKHVYYFNFLDYGDGTPVLPRTVMPDIAKACRGISKIWIAHNIKFDLGMLRAEGIDLEGELYDTMVIERILDNNLESGSFSLDATSKRYDEWKDDKVKEFIEANNLYTEVDIPGVQRKVRNLHFDRVPADLMIPYACQDTRAVLAIMEKQIPKLAEASKLSSKISYVFENECKLIRTVQRMEEIGVLVDRDYCAKARDHYAYEKESAIEHFKKVTGKDFTDSNDLLAEVLVHHKDTWVYGPPSKVKGEVTPRFDYDILDRWAGDPIADSVIRIRDAKKNLDYFHSFLHNSQNDGRIHTNFNQHITKTGRFSSSSPNLQNLTSDDKSAYPVRRALIPDPGYQFFSLDYDQIEYRMALDYAGAKGLISKILNDGLDVHTATANIAGVDRSMAKAVNFAILYGAGDKRISENLKISQTQAKSLRSRVMDGVPELRAFINKVQRTIDDRGYVFTWMGRLIQFPYVMDNRWNKYTRNSYKGVNHLIQGGCADVIKKAMNDIHLLEVASVPQFNQLLTIHDELVFRVRIGEENVVKNIKDIMENAYPAQHIRLTVGIDYSDKSLADLKPWTL